MPAVLLAAKEYIYRNQNFCYEKDNSITGSFSGFFLFMQQRERGNLSNSSDENG